MAHRTDRLSFGEILSLPKIRETLIRQEETIIFSLIERAQWKQNLVCYEPDHASFSSLMSSPGESFLGYFLRETETVHAKVRRYTSPDEHPFTENLPQPILPALSYPKLIEHKAKLNINSEIKDIYLSKILSQISEPGDDLNYGSSCTADISCLQALSKRIHMGKFVAEAKFQDDTETYTRLIQEKDEDGIMKLLTKPDVEVKLLKRVELKAATYGQEVDGTDTATPRYKIKPGLVRDLYETYIIPLTKKVEVEYLMQRLQ
eukprot:GFYU01018133.1.p1 GENE.GFYU01018133.1~~GFYU01018133.1.p1  ORF type:complete len:261 (-),score=39.68 GFYU01018133.1:23-805(-)